MRESPNPAWVLALLLLIAGIALPTGFYGGFLPWFLIESIAAALLCRFAWTAEVSRLNRGWQAAWPLAAWLAISALLALLQLALGSTESRFDTFRQLHHFAGGLLVIPMVWLAFPLLCRESFSKGAVPLGSVLLVLSLTWGALASGAPNPDGNALVWWPFVYRNHYAAFVLLLLPALVWAAFTFRESRWWAATGIVAGVAGVVSCGSRSGIVLLAILLGALAVILPAKGKRRDTVRLLVAAGSLVAAGIALADAEILAWRLRNAGPLLEGRLEYWHASLKMIAERPLLGWGFGTWPEVYLQFLTRDSGLVVNHAHSDWLEYTAEGGILVPIALATLFARSLWLSLRYPWALGVPAMLLLAMVDYPLRLPLLLLGMILVYCASELAHRGDICASELAHRSEESGYSKPPEAEGSSWAVEGVRSSGMDSIIARTFR
ncbi:MAG: O-antigen ligase family protein [Bryobacterales bacterium]|nr:O-antigen ligase family protein [Bryobacterales bacterium]